MTRFLQRFPLIIDWLPRRRNSSRLGKYSLRKSTSYLFNVQSRPTLRLAALNFGQNQILGLEPWPQPCFISSILFSFFRSLSNGLIAWAAPGALPGGSVWPIKSTPSKSNSLTLAYSVALGSQNKNKETGNEMHATYLSSTYNNVRHAVSN